MINALWLVFLVTVVFTLITQVAVPLFMYRPTWPAFRRPGKLEKALGEAHEDIDLAAREALLDELVSQSTVTRTPITHASEAAPEGEAPHADVRHTNDQSGPRRADSDPPVATRRRNPPRPLADRPLGVQPETRRSRTR